MIEDQVHDDPRGDRHQQEIATVAAHPAVPPWRFTQPIATPVGHDIAGAVLHRTIATAVIPTLMPATVAPGDVMGLSITAIIVIPIVVATMIATAIVMIVVVATVLPTMIAIVMVLAVVVAVMPVIVVVVLSERSATGEHQHRSTCSRQTE